MRLSARFSGLLAAVVVSFMAPVAAGRPGPGNLAQIEVLQDTLAAVADEARPSVVAVRADRRLEVTDSSPDGSGLPDDELHRRLRRRVAPAVGSGVIISPDGLILTNEHVIHNARPDAIECVLANGERYTVQGITSDPRSDLAVLRVDARDLEPARLGDLSEVKQGHFAIVMGNPFGSASEGKGAPAMSFGIIGGLGQDLTEKLDRERYYGNLIQTDARINPGNSGGPLLNIKGEVIGIITAIWSRSGGNEDVGYAIAIESRTKSIIAQLARGEEVEYGYLGVGLEEPTAEDRQRTGSPTRGGALIDEVRFGTPAAAARLRPGDVVVEFDGGPVASVDHLIRLVGAARVGVPVDVTICRDKKRLTVALTPARREPAIRAINVEVPLSWRGMTLENPTPEVRDRFSLPDTTVGIVVTHVKAGGVADKAGLKPGQVIRQIGGEPIKGVRRLRKTAAVLPAPVKIIVEADPPVEVILP